MEGTRTANRVTAALVATAFVMPNAAIVLTFLLYFLRPGSTIWHDTGTTNQTTVVSDKVEDAVYFILAVIAATLVWFVAAWWFRQFTTVKRANSGVYAKLRGRFADLTARLPAAPDPNDAPKAAAYERALAQKTLITNALASDAGDTRWVAATGYSALWRSLHRAEEELLILADPQDVIREAQSDELRLKDSKIPAEDDLLILLHNAMVGLGQTGNPQWAKPNPPPSPEQSRATLAVVRHAINEFRVDRWDGLIRARNHAYATGMLTGLSVVLLLGLVIVTVSNDPQRDPQTRHAVISVGMLYFVGAIAGLFNRMRLDLGASTAVEDYGLATVRLINTPLFAGIAAVIGVLASILLPDVLSGILPTAATATATATTTAVATAAPSATGTPQSATATATVVATVTPAGAAATNGAAARGTPSVSATPTEQPPPANLPAGRTATLRTVFDPFTYPLEFVIAVIFGLTPTLVFDRLEKKTDAYKQDLMSTESPEQNVGQQG